MTSSPVSSNLGKQITWSGLDTATSTHVWTDGYESKMVRLYESPSLLVIQQVTVAGNTETAYIEKLNARFLFIPVGALAAANKGNAVTVNEYRGTLS